jgi:hypothetical protein
MSSLDYRLRDASHISTEIVNILQDLDGLIEDATGIIRGEKTPWDQLGEESSDTEPDEDDEQDLPSTELGQLTEAITDAVNCLLRLSVAIKNPAPHDRFIGSQATDMSYFEPFDIQHVNSKFNTVKPWLAERLGKAISRRRQYFRYRESHHAKLAQGLDRHDAGESDTIAETVASSIPDHFKDILGSSSIQTFPAIFEDDRSDTGASQTSYASSAGDSDRLRIPALPEDAHRGPFQCRFCYMMIVAKNRADWK